MPLQQVGVELVIEGLSAFIGGMEKANSVMDKMRPTATALQKAFDSAGDAITSFGEKIWDVVSITMGVLFRDAIEGVISAMGELIQLSFEAAEAFQSMEIRLRGMNLNDLLPINNIAGVEYTQVLEIATQRTKEQLDWIMKLAAQTPFDAVDIANTYTLARSYGFANDEAQKLTMSINDFTAGMGLTNVEAERVIINLGQMVQRGKITTREINDLARGAFVPIADVLDRVSEKMGITTEELTKLISKPGGGVDPQLFIDAFMEMTATEERFMNASQKMARTFQYAFENITQTARDMIGLFILKPAVLGPVGEYLASIMDVVTERWDNIVNAATRVGDALKGVVENLLGMMPSAESIVDAVIRGLNSLGAWIMRHEDDIVNFFRGIQNVITTQVVPWIENNLVPAFEELSAWVTENLPLIKEFIDTLAEIGLDVIGNVLKDIFNVDFEEGTGISGFLQVLKEGMQWIIDNQDKLTTLLTWLTEMYVMAQLAATVWNLLWGAVAGFVAFFTNIGNVISLAIQTITVDLTLFSKIVQTKLEDGVNGFTDWLIYEAIPSLLSTIQMTFLNFDWFNLGLSLAQRLVDGIMSALSNLVINIPIIGVGIGAGIEKGAKESLAIKSPSGVFEDIGTKIVAGLTMGITGTSSAATKAMEDTFSEMTDAGTKGVDKMADKTLTFLVPPIVTPATIARQGTEDKAPNKTVTEDSFSDTLQDLLDTAKDILGVTSDTSEWFESGGGGGSDISVEAPPESYSGRGGGGWWHRRRDDPNIVNYYNNLNLSSMAPRENLMVDFALLASLQGG